MLFEFKKVAIFLSTIGPTLAMAQTGAYNANINTKPVTYERLHLEALVGVGMSKLPLRPARLVVDALPTPYAELALVLPVTPRGRVRPSVSYQVVGNSLKHDNLLGHRAKANRNLSYLSAQVQAGYVVSRLTDRTQIELQGGFFAAKQLEDVTVNRDPDQGLIREQSINSSIKGNYGVVSGISVSKRINQHHRVGLKALYHQGIIDIRTPTSKQNTGELPIVTQAFTICTFFSI